MNMSSYRWLAHLLSPARVSIIAISALQIIATPLPASAASAPGQAETLRAEAAGKAGIRHCRDRSQSGVPSVVREHPKPPKKGDIMIKMGGQAPILSQSPRLSIPKRSAKS